MFEPIKLPDSEISRNQTSLAKIRIGNLRFLSRKTTTMTSTMLAHSNIVDLTQAQIQQKRLPQALEWTKSFGVKLRPVLPQSIVIAKTPSI